MKFLLSSIPALVLGATLAGSVQAAPTLSAHARAQIADILKVKESFTPAERKMDSQLVFAARLARGESVGTAAAPLIHAAPAGRVEVDIRTRGKVGKPLRVSVAGLGGTVRNFQKAKGQVHATVPLTALSALAADPTVVNIRRAMRPKNDVGALNSQGVPVMKARNVINGLGITGAGVTVGVISDSASAVQVALLKGTGDLNGSASVLAPYVDPDTGGDRVEDEGAAMMEIVQDMAPDAKIIFASAYNGEADFAGNIIKLQQAGCQIIVDDVQYYDEGAFQDGIVAQAVNTVTAAGVLYFSSAGNEGNVLNGTSSTWEGDFVDSGISDSLTFQPDPDNLPNVTVRKDFTYALIGADPYDVITRGISPIMDLKWSDPLGGSTNDYDFFVLDPTATDVVGFSASVQDGTQDPVEVLGLFDADGNLVRAEAGDLILVTATTGVTTTDSSTTPATVTTTAPVTLPRYLRLSAEGSELDVATAGATNGHNAAAATFTTGATFWNSAKRGAKANRAQDAHPTENFSSDGPRRIFYTPDGTPYTPGNVLADGGIVLRKPDATAVDGNSCVTPNFTPFFGTSSSSPHAAGVAALIKSYNPALTNRQVRDLMTSHTLDSETPGFDVTSGYGVIDALAAVLAAPAPTGR